MKVFFSHSHRDAALVREVRNQIPRSFGAWIDELDMLGGAPLADTLARVIKSESDFVVVFLGREAIGSDWVRKELEWALEREKELGAPFVIPVLVDDVRQQVEPVELRHKNFLDCIDQRESGVKRFAEELTQQITAWLVQRIEEFERRATPLGGHRASRIWRRRADIAPAEWIKIFAQAERRIWLLGHSMLPAVDPSRSGSILADRLAAGVDLRLVVLDPFGAAQQQISEISKRIDEPDLNNKIIRTLRGAANLEKRVAELATKDTVGDVLLSDSPRISIGVSDWTMHSSIVIVDDRFLVTIYSTNKEMGDTGITLDMNSKDEDEGDLCAFFESDFLTHWRRSRSFYDVERTLPRVELRILNHQDHARASMGWYDVGASLRPPHLAVIFPTYRCLYGPRRDDTDDATTNITGPFGEQLLCPNCMYGNLLTGPKPREMTVERFGNLCAELAEFGVKIIEVSGGGEPLHHADARLLFERLKSLKDVDPSFAQCGLLSNVAALAGCNFREDILQVMDYVRWSWPEDAELQPSLKNCYVEQLASLLQLRKDIERRGESTPVRIGVKFLVTKNSVQSERDELSSVIYQLFELGIDHVKVRTLRSATNSPNVNQLRRAQDLLARLVFKLERHGFLTDPKTLEVDISERYVPTEYRCKLSPMFTLIEPTGNVRMCWNDTTPDPRRVIGNTFETGFREIWGGPRHREVCHTMDPALVCNLEHGCHCRIVGYEEMAGQLEVKEPTSSVAAAQQISVDGFL